MNRKNNIRSELTLRVSYISYKENPLFQQKYITIIHKSTVISLIMLQYGGTTLQLYA